MDNKKLFWGLALGLGIAVMIYTVFFSGIYRSKEVTTDLIAEDIQKLGAIFTTINTQCEIISFDYQQNPINFLNVGTFTSSEVGPMNLARADKWQGPYVEDNPNIQGKEYMVVRTKKGYFITPGNGVKLSNGKVIGKDIVLNEDADIKAMMRDPNILLINDKAMAMRLKLTKPSKYQEVFKIPD